MPIWNFEIFRSQTKLVSNKTGDRKKSAERSNSKSKYLKFQTFQTFRSRTSNEPTDENKTYSPDSNISWRLRVEKFTNLLLPTFIRSNIFSSAIFVKVCSLCLRRKFSKFCRNNFDRINRLRSFKFLLINISNFPQTFRRNFLTNR